MSSNLIFLVLVVSGISASNVEQESSSLVFDLFIKTLIKTFQTPISEREAKTKLSVNIMLENDVFNLDDALRLFIQQFIVALYDGRIHLLPDDWETRYPAYAKVINEINNVLDIIGQRTLSQISMKDVRPFIKALTFDALADLRLIINAIEHRANEEAENVTEKGDKTENSAKAEL